MKHQHKNIFSRKLYLSLVLTVPIIALSLSKNPYSPLLQLILSTFVMLYGATPFFRGFLSELRMRTPGMMTLVSLALIAGYSYSIFIVFIGVGMPFFSELVTLIDIMLLGHYLEMRSLETASSAVEALTKLLPAIAHLMVDDSIESIPTSSVERGMKLLIKPGEKVPADGVILTGESEVQQAALTGESLPIYKSSGDQILAGSINGNSSLIIEVSKDAHENYISHVIGLVHEVMQSKSALQDRADKIAQLLTYGALSLGIITIIIAIVTGHTFAFALERFVTVMVTACPHALGLAIPLVIVVVSSRAAQKGLLIRNRKAFDEAADLNVVVFDKTGTLTTGAFSITDVQSVGNLSEDNLIAFAASSFNYAQHALSQAFLNKAEHSRIPLMKATEGQTIPGKGVYLTIDSQPVIIGNKALLEQFHILCDLPTAHFMQQGKTVTYVAIAGKCEGIIAARDTLRSASFKTIEELKSFGIKTAMITGDTTLNANSIAHDLNIDTVYAEILPDKKAEIIKNLQQQGNKVGMVGDGINDAPALAAAAVGVAVSAGTDVAKETADIILVSNDLHHVIDLIDLSKLSRKKINQNIFIAIAYNVIALPIAAGIFEPFGISLSPAIGAIAMSLSTIIVALNARWLETTQAAAR